MTLDSLLLTRLKDHLEPMFMDWTIAQEGETFVLWVRSFKDRFGAVVALFAEVSLAEDGVYLSYKPVCLKYESRWQRIKIFGWQDPAAEMNRLLQAGW
jgi:hypothetical protein